MVLVRASIVVLTTSMHMQLMLSVCQTLAFSMARPPPPPPPVEMAVRMAAAPTPLVTIPDTFVSFGWEVGAMLGEAVDYQDPRFVRIASHLSPAVIRVGGITADFMRYTAGTNSSSRVRGADSEPVVRVGGSSWPTSERNLSIDTLLNLTASLAAANLSLMLDLNELHGRDCHTPKPECPTNPGCQTWCKGPWDMSNVRWFLQELHDRRLVRLRPGGGSSSSGLGGAGSTRFRRDRVVPHGDPDDGSNSSSGDSERESVSTNHVGANGGGGAGDDEGYRDAGVVAPMAQPLYAFEVGNELASHEYARNTTADMVALAGLIQHIWSDVTADRRPGLYGPSTDQCKDPMQREIITNISNIPGVAGFTFHSYPAHNGTGVDALEKLLLNVTWLRTAILGQQGTDAAACIASWNATKGNGNGNGNGPRHNGFELLVTEASSSYNWKLPADTPAQNSFLHTLFTVAELGQYATTGVGMVARWSLMEESPFGMIRRHWEPDTDAVNAADTDADADAATRADAQRGVSGGHSYYEVAADYWLILAHKATVGTVSLGVVTASDSPALVYAYCGKEGEDPGKGRIGGSLVIAAANPSSTEVVLLLNLEGTPKPSAELSRIEYVFTAPNGNLSSVAPLLNGHAILTIDANGDLPAAFAGHVVPAGTNSSIRLPPRSAGYYKLLDAGVPACIKTSPRRRRQA